MGQDSFHASLFQTNHAAPSPPPVSRPGTSDLPQQIGRIVAGVLENNKCKYKSCTRESIKEKVKIGGVKEIFFEGKSNLTVSLNSWF